MADGGNTPPAAANGDASSSSSSSSDSSSKRALPTPEELLATFESLRAEHQAESEKISLLSSQLRGRRRKKKR